MKVQYTGYKVNLERDEWNDLYHIQTLISALQIHTNNSVKEVNHALTALNDMMTWIKDNTLESDITPIGLDLMSSEQYKLFNDIIPDVSGWWWLRPSEDVDEATEYVDSNGSVRETRMMTPLGGVRPILWIKTNNSDIKAGNKFKFFDYSWTILDDNIALCDDIILYASLNSEDCSYEKTEIKEYLDSLWQDMKYTI